MATVNSTPRTITEEVGYLAAEIFSTTYGMTWDAAVTEAVNSLRDVLAYAAEWDQQLLFTAPLNGREPAMAEVH